MAPPTSIAWQFFTLDAMDPTAAKCHLCRRDIRIVKNTSPLIAHLRCKHPEVLQKKEFADSDIFVAELADVSTQTCAKDFPNPIKVEEEDEVKTMEYDKNLRMREIMSRRLDDAVGDMYDSKDLDKYPQLVRLLVESCMWLIRDWPGQKEIDDLETARASRKAVLGRLHQFLRVRPPRTCEMESHLLMLADAIELISEQWPEGEWDKASPAPEPAPPISAPQRVIVQKRPHHQPQPNYLSAPVKQLPPANLRPVLGTPGTSHQQPAAKVMRINATPQQLSNSPVNSFPPSSIQARNAYRMMPQAGNAGSPSRLWSFFTKMIGESGELLAKCNICRRLVTRQNHGTTGMKQHLKSNHPQEYASLDSASTTMPEPSHSPYTHFISMPDLSKADTTGNAQPSVSAIVAALNSGPSSSHSGDTRNSPLFSEDNIKEEDVEYEEIDFEEEVEKYKAATGFEEDPVYEPTETEIANAQLASLKYVSTPKNATSDVWKYFTKEDVGADKHGRCTLCDWSKKIYNHGTNIMWSHLRRTHPAEYSILKPHEYNPAVHGEFVPSSVPGCAVVPGGGLRMVPAGAVPSHLQMPRLPVQAGEDLVKDE